MRGVCGIQFDIFVIIMAKTSTERSRIHRQRKSQQAQARPPPKTGAQRVREYRARQKALKAAAVIVSHPTSQILGDIAQVAGPSTELQFDVDHTITSIPCEPYTNFNAHKSAHKQFEKQFINNPFGSACSICDRLWFKNDITSISHEQEEIIRNAFPENNDNAINACKSCKQSLNRGNVPTLSKFNGFKYPEKPAHLPKLDLISERLISPRIPFMQIRRLRHVHGQFGIFGQIINVPVSVNNMVNSLPRNIDDDHCVNVHIKRKKIHKSSYLMGLVNKRNIKIWLEYLITTPLYNLYDIKIDDSFLNSDSTAPIPQNDISEEIPIEESLTAQQHTLLWNDDKYLRIAPGEQNIPKSLLFDEHAEELSFPSIYLGQFRSFKEGLNVTPYMMASSELRRSDRRGVTPYHLLYMSMKIMRLRVRDSLTIAFKHIGKNTNVTRQQIESEEYINSCLESNLGFLRTIPNSAWYWAQRKKDLFSMIRQLGKPTIFLTLSANEIGWTSLLYTLYRLKNDGAELSKEEIDSLHYLEKSTLINEDAVTCAIYFHKLVNILITILQSKKISPFGNYRVLEYFKRIEFQHRGSPHAHILLWLDNAPKDPLGANKQDAINLIDQLISVQAKEASGNIKLQTHKHTFTCYKKILPNKQLKCRFEAPFLPSRATMILTPMPKTEPGFVKYAERYKNMRLDLEENDYLDIDAFFEKNQIISDQHYIDVLRAGITRPKVFLKRTSSEKWHNPFNPFIFNPILTSSSLQKNIPAQLMS